MVKVLPFAEIVCIFLCSALCVQIADILIKQRLLELECFILQISTKLAFSFSSFIFLMFQEKNLLNSLQCIQRGKKKAFSHVK